MEPDANDPLADLNIDDSVHKLRRAVFDVDMRLKQRERQREKQEPIMLPSTTFLAKLQAKQVQASANAALHGASPVKGGVAMALPAALARETAAQGYGNRNPYAPAIAAAIEVANATGAVNAASAGKLTSRSKPPAPVVSQGQHLHAAHRTTRSTAASIPSPQRKSAPTTAGDIISAGGVPQGSILALPGQLGYKALLQTAQRSRAAEVSTLQRELEGMDDEIDAFLAAERFERAAPDAALVFQTAWRARGPRLLFNRYMQRRRRSQAMTTAVFFYPLLQFVGALRHQRKRLLRRCFQEWLELCTLKTLLFMKVLARLRASMIDVRDSQSPSHLWRLCTAPGEDPWNARFSLGTLCRNLIESQAPRRRLGMYFGAWHERVAGIRSRRSKAIAVLLRMETRRTREWLQLLLRFWYRWSVVKVAERLGISPPLFRPRISAWDAWQWEHNRSRELHSRVEQLHRGFRMRHCFRFWHFFTQRNARMRRAWVGAASAQIEDMMRYALNCLKANWQMARTRRRVRGVVFKEWHNATLRNILVRTVAREAETVSRTAIKRQVMRQMREWCAASRLLNMSATVQIQQRRTLCVITLYAWTNDHAHLWFVAAWYAWRSVAVGRLRMSTLLGSHMQRMAQLGLELSFKGWRRAASEQRAWREQLAARRSAREVRHHVRALHRAQQAAIAAYEGANLQSTSKVGRAAGRRSTSQVMTSIGSGPPSAPQSARVCVVSPVDEGNTPPAGQSSKDSISLTSRRTSRSSGNDGLRLAALQSEEGDDEEVFTEDEELDDMEDEILDESVQVTVGDYLAPVPWRPVVSREALLASNDTTPAPMTLSRIARLVDDLWEVEGRFRPGYGNDRSLALDVAVRGALGPFQAQWADRTQPPSRHWLEQATPDPWLWQRLVALMMCQVAPHPEQAAGPMVGHGTMPWAEELAAKRRRQRAERMRWVVDGGEGGLGQDDDGGDREDAADRAILTCSRLWSGDMSPWGQDGARALGGGSLKRRQPLPAYVGALPPEVAEVVWLWKLAVAEDFLETGVAALMNLGSRDLPQLYRAVEAKAAKAGRSVTGLGVRGWEGDLLTWLLRGPAHHDATFMAASALYRANRDRVITMGMELHERAMAVAKHCPEFTLTYPEYNPSNNRGALVRRVDDEPEDMPAPPPRLPSAQDVNAAESRPSSTDKANARPKSPARPSTSGMTKSELIRMEMLSPTGTMAPRTPPTLPTPLPAVVEMPSEANSGRNTVADKQNGIVLGAAAAAILAARAAATKKGQPQQPLGPKLRSKPTPHFNAWRPGGTRRMGAAGGIGSQPSGPPGARPPRIKRLPPVPRIRSVSPTRKRTESEESEGGDEDGEEAGAAALQAMLRQGRSMSGAAPDPDDDTAPGSPIGGQGNELDRLLIHTVSKKVEVVKPKPYLWFDGPARIFPSVTEVPVPDDPPSMQDLNHRSARLLEQKLSTSLYPVPSMPDIVFKNWGRAVGEEDEEDVPEGEDAVREDALEAVASQDMLASRAARSESEAILRRAQPSVSGALVAEGSSDHVLVPPELTTSAPELGGENSEARLAIKAKLATMGPGLDLTNLFGLQLTQEDSAPAPVSYREKLGEGMDRYIERQVSDMRNVGKDLDEDPSSQPDMGAADHDQGQDEWAGAGAGQQGQGRGSSTGGAMSFTAGNDVFDEEQALLLQEQQEQQQQQALDENARLAAQVRKKRAEAASKQGLALPDRFPPSDDKATSVVGDTGTGEGETPLISSRRTSRSHRRGSRSTASSSQMMTPRDDAQTPLAAPALLGLVMPPPEEVREALEAERERGRTRSTPHTFTVTPQQLNIFLGGHLRFRQPREVDPNTPRPDDGDQTLEAGQGGYGDQCGEVTLDLGAPFEDKYNPARVIHTDSVRRRELLDGFDLRAELSDLMGSGAAPGALAGAEAALLGLRNLTLVEEEAVKAELDRLEREIQIAGGHRRVRSPRHGGYEGVGASSLRRAQSRTATTASQVPPPPKSAAPPSRLRGEAGGEGTLQGGPSGGSSPRGRNQGGMAPINENGVATSLSSPRRNMAGPAGTAPAHPMPTTGEGGVFEAFPDRPPSDSSYAGRNVVSAANSSIAAAGLDAVYRQRSPPNASRDNFEVSVYDSLAVPGASDLQPPLGDQERADPALLFSSYAQPGQADGGRRTRRRSNLRAAPAPLFTPPLDSARSGTSPPVRSPLPPLPENVDAESAAQLEALRSMWSAAPYSDAPPDLDSEAAMEVANLVAAAAEDEWRRYEEAAGQLVEELAAAMASHSVDAQDVPRGGAPLSPAPQGPPSPPPQHRTLARALDLMEFNLAAAIDPGHLTGLSLQSYGARMSDLMGRLVVAPMATRYLFWKKVQSVQQLRQRVMEDRGLEDQLKSITWAATFQPGHAATPPSGLLPPRKATAHAAAAPTPAQTGAPPGLRPPTGWAAGALSVAAAPRQPWFTPAASQTSPYAPAPMVSLPMRLQTREVPGGRPAVLPPVAFSSADNRQAEGPVPIPAPRPQSAPRPSTQGSHTDGDAAGPVVQGGEGSVSSTSFPPTASEVLAARLAVLLERRRWQREQEAAVGGQLTMAELDQKEEEVARLAELTIKLNRDALDRKRGLHGNRVTTMVPGNRGNAVGLMQPDYRPPPPGYNGRDTYVDTTDPFTVPPRSRPHPGNFQAGLVTTNGLTPLSITAHRHNAGPIAKSLKESGMLNTVAVVDALPSARDAPPTLEDGKDHLPHPSGQARPAPRVPSHPLAPVAPPPQHPNAGAQPGNIHFVTPHERAYVSELTRLVDNAYFPGPFSVGVAVDPPKYGRSGRHGDAGPEGEESRGALGGESSHGQPSVSARDGSPWSVGSSSVGQDFGVDAKEGVQQGGGGAAAGGWGSRGSSAASGVWPWGQSEGGAGP